MPNRMNDAPLDIETASEPLVQALASALRARGWRLATAESCTGGLIAACCTAVAGSSEWFDRGVVSYSNAAKTDYLGVSPALIEAHGAVSQHVACAMVEGLLARSAADLAVAVTGIAGPGGGSASKPVGTVWVAWGTRGGPVCSELFHLAGDRRAVRHLTVLEALSRCLQQASA